MIFSSMAQSVKALHLRNPIHQYILQQFLECIRTYYVRFSRGERRKEGRMPVITFIMT